MKVVSYSPDWHDRLLAFRRRIYPDNAWGHRDAHVRWRFLGHPHQPPQGAPGYLLAVEGDEIIGQWAAIPDRIHAGERSVDCDWMVDLVVAPEHRDTMAAMALFRAASRGARPLLAIGAPAEMLPFYDVFRWTRLSVADTFYSVIRPGPLLRLAGRQPDGWRALGLAAGDHLAPLAWRLDPSSQALLDRVEDLPAFGPELDPLFARLRRRVGAISERTAATLSWKFEQRPCGQHRVLALRHAEGSLRACLTLKLRRRAGVASWLEVADLLVLPEDDAAFDALVAAARRAALQAGVDFIRLRCSLPEHTARLRQPRWFRRVRTPMDDLFVHAAGQPQALDLLLARPWYYTAFCSDAVDTGLDEWDAPPPAGWSRD